MKHLSFEHFMMSFCGQKNIKIVLQHKCKMQLMERDTQCPVGFKLVTVMNQSTVVPLSLSLCCCFKCLDPL